MILLAGIALGLVTGLGWAARIQVSMKRLFFITSGWFWQQSLCRLGSVPIPSQ
ncbi:MAG: hypothetical protein IPG80_12045 [Anaerolineales bacterium]|uniref:hypothetical protein n=1 Tax=Candidatus Villigracilis vicinus TaxID=3140679 RepID=UPI0031350815|nr:hypothetical protein [Anaerolineales bacterium]